MMGMPRRIKLTTKSECGGIRTPLPQRERRHGAQPLAHPLAAGAGPPRVCGGADDGLFGVLDRPSGAPLQRGGSGGLVDHRKGAHWHARHPQRRRCCPPREQLEELRAALLGPAPQHDVWNSRTVAAWLSARAGPAGERACGVALSASARLHAASRRGHGTPRRPAPRSRRPLKKPGDQGGGASGGASRSRRGGVGHG